MTKNKPIVLVILDGWGVAPPSLGNAITLASTPCFNFLIQNYFTCLLNASGEAVGLPWGERGNSEVGHFNLGSGLILYQSFPRITQAIWSGEFFKNPAFLKAIEHVKKNNSKLHLLGLVSHGGIHSYIDHLYALIELAKREGLKEVYIQAILDGRDTDYNAGLEIISKFLKRTKDLGIGKIASLSGRFYAMDRDNRWERIEKAYRAIAEGRAEKKFSNPLEAIQESYQQGIFDEQFFPIALYENDKPIAKIEDNDAIIFFNFREDRAREITKAFVLDDFKFFERKKLNNLFFVSMLEYEKGLPVSDIAFKEEKIVKYPLARILSENNLKQLHIAETEKYAHVTFFFNSGIEEPFKNEERILIPSPKVESYDLKPEMSCLGITEEVVKNISIDRFDFYVINFANPDMVGHTGNIKATIKAIEVVDQELEKIFEATLAKEGILIVTADHGNAEELINLQTGEIDKEHSNNPVPFILVSKDFEEKKAEIPDLSLMRPFGVLADVAPTVLKLLKIEKPKEMIGRPLI